MTHGRLSQDPNKPKRAMSAFFLYSQANRQTVKEEYPDSAFGDVVSRFPAEKSLSEAPQALHAILGGLLEWG